MPQPQKTLRAQQRELTQRRIVDAARRTFAERGVAAATFDHIALEASVSRATLYLHFQNKEAILLELLKHDLRSVRDMFGSLPSAANSGRGAVIAWLENYVATLQRHRGDLRLFSIAIANDPGITSLIREHRALIADGIGPRDAKGAQDTPTPRQRTQLLMLIARIDEIASALSAEACDLDRSTALDIVASEVLAALKPR